MWGVGYGGGGGIGGTFEKKYSVLSVAMSGRENLEEGDKILLPPSAFEQLSRMEVDYPMLFRISNDALGRNTHCGVLEFTAEEGRCYMPFWMMQNLCIEENSLVSVKNVSLSTATFVKFRAQSCDFLEISNPRAVLEYTLRKYTCLTTGDIICLPYSGSKYHLEVTEVQPSGKASIVECNVNIDFEEPVGYKEYSEKQRSRSGSLAGGSGSAAGSSSNSLGSAGGGEEGGATGPVRAVQKAKAGGDDEDDDAAGGVFTAFKGNAQRIDGKVTASSSSSADIAAAKAARLAAAEARATAATTAEPVVSTERKSRIGGKFSKKASAVSAFTGTAKKLS